ncbi:hypothetical protein HK105_205956 [Polyrhizophydium stewartii]|uniref:Ankyrin repeat protein n=1 Tax=Polyrhizophydium stewartii TaxID=2732419 RepID=A0ABR4N517_9FUNG
MNAAHAAIAEQLAAVQSTVDVLVAAVGVPGEASPAVSAHVHSLAGRFGTLAQSVRALSGTPHAAKRPRPDDDGVSPGGPPPAGAGGAKAAGAEPAIARDGATTAAPSPFSDLLSLLAPKRPHIAKRVPSVFGRSCGTPSHWDRLPKELHAMVLARASPFTKLRHRIAVDVDALSKAEKRALWRDIFDADWKPGTQWQSLKPKETLSVCTNKDLRHIRTIDMFKLIRDNIKRKAGLAQVAMRRGWFDCVSYSDATPANLRDADLDFEQFRSVIERFKVRVNLELIAAAAETGRIDVIQWLRTVATKGIWRKQIMDAAARSGHLELVKWLHENIKVGCSEAAMNGAAGNGHLHVVEWLQNNRREGCTDAELDQAAANGHLAAVEWLHNNRREGCTRLAMDNAAGNGHLAVVEFLHNNRTEGCSKAAMDSAAANGHLGVVEFLHNNRTEGCTVLAMTSAAENGHVAVVEFLHLNRTEGCDPDVINNAARNGHLPVVEFLHRHRAMTCSQFTLNMLMLNDQLNVARFLIAECGLMPSDDTLLSSVRFSNPGRLRLVVELGLHHRLPIERIVSDIDEEALKTIAEHSTDAQRAEMMRIVTRKGNMKAMNVLQKHWPSVVDGITMANLCREYSYRADNDPNKVRFLELSMLDFVFKHRRDMLDDAWAAENLSLAVTHARHGHTAWIRSRFPAVFAANPASKIDGEAADAIIDTLAKSGERSAMGSLEFAIKRGDVAAVKWLLANIHTADGKFEKRVKGWHSDLLADVSVARVGLYASRRGKCSSEHQLEELRRGMSLEELRTNPDFEPNGADNPIVVDVLPPPKGETKSVYILFEDDDLDTSREPTEINEKTFNIYLELYGGFEDVSSNLVSYVFDTLENGKTYRMH